MTTETAHPNKFTIGQYVMGFWTMPFAGHISMFRWDIEKKKRYYQIPEALKDTDEVEEDLLKPYDQEQFERAWEKWLEVIKFRGFSAIIMNELVEILRPGEC